MVPTQIQYTSEFVQNPSLHIVEKIVFYPQVIPKYNIEICNRITHKIIKIEFGSGSGGENSTSGSHKKGLGLTGSRSAQRRIIRNIII